MCGIAGLIGAVEKQGPVESLAQRMADKLHHRGPDGAAYYADENALLVHTRLSIIDLAGGTQPIHNEDKTLWVVFNGEIFNYLELRRLLLSKGHEFYTQTDTEVIVHLYEEFGENFVDKLNGQFAIALWDKQHHKTLLVRDRVGITPLYFTRDAGGLWFASEVKSLLAGQGRSPAIDRQAFSQMLRFWAPVTPASIFADIEQVRPGEVIVYQDEKLTRRIYWDFDFPEPGNYLRVTENEAAEQIHDLLVDATQLRLRADVPVAAYLSGGLDSSIITAIIARHSNAHLRTFSLTFEAEDLDEQPYQAQLVKHLQAEHSSVSCSEQNVADDFQKAVWFSEAPLIRTAPIPMGRLSAHVREQEFKVVLTGEGADEVFGGYDIFKEAKLRHFWSKNPESVWRPLLLKRLYPYLQLPNNRANTFLKQFFGFGIEDVKDPFFSHRTRMNTTSMVEMFTSDAMGSETSSGVEEALLKELPDAFSGWSYFNKAQYLEAKTLMGGYLLSSQGDRMLMMNSVEGRFPFLDHRLMEYVNQLPPSFKMKALNEKYILKQAMQRYLPKDIVKRYKQPYRAPMIAPFLLNGKTDWAEALLSPELIDSYGYFDSKKTELLKRKVKADKALSYKDNMALIVMLSTQSWHQQFIADFTGNFQQPRVGATPLQRIQ